MTKAFEHGSLIEGYGVIIDMYHTNTHTVYVCHSSKGGFKYYKRPL